MQISTEDQVVDFFDGLFSEPFRGRIPDRLKRRGVVTKPDLVAPGAQIYSCIPPEKRPDRTYEYTYMAGTSMATPHVAGVATLLMAAKPGCARRRHHHCVEGNRQAPRRDSAPTGQSLGVWLDSTC